MPDVAGESFGEFDEAGVDLIKTNCTVRTWVSLANRRRRWYLLQKRLQTKPSKKLQKAAQSGVFKRFAKDILGTGAKVVY